METSTLLQCSLWIVHEVTTVLSNNGRLDDSERTNKTLNQETVRNIPLAMNNDNDLTKLHNRKI